MVLPITYGPFNLKEIKEFNPALIYGFEPEPSARHQSGSYENEIHLSGQILDMYDAYKYAETVVLAKIKEIGIHNITSDLILTWLNEIHKRIAKTLAHDIETPDYAGSYCKEQIFRCHLSTNYTILLMAYLAETSYHVKFIHKSNLIAQALNHGISKKRTEQFIELLTKLSKDLLPFHTIVTRVNHSEALKVTYESKGHFLHPHMRDVSLSVGDIKIGFMKYETEKKYLHILELKADKDFTNVINLLLEIAFTKSCEHKCKGRVQIEIPKAVYERWQQLGFERLKEEGENCTVSLSDAAIAKMGAAFAVSTVGQDAAPSVADAKEHPRKSSIAWDEMQQKLEQANAEVGRLTALLADKDTQMILLRQVTAEAVKAMSPIPTLNLARCIERLAQYISPYCQYTRESHSLLFFHGATGRETAMNELLTWLTKTSDSIMEAYQKGYVALMAKGVSISTEEVHGLYVQGVSSLISALKERVAEVKGRNNGHSLRRYLLSFVIELEGHLEGDFMQPIQFAEHVEPASDEEYARCMVAA